MISVESQPAREQTTELARWIRPSAALLGLATAGWGQLMIEQGADWQSAVLVFLVAAALFVYGTWPIAVDRPSEPEADAAETPFRLALLAFALLLAAAAFIFSSGNRFRIPGVLAWAASIVLYLYALPHSWDAALALQSLRTRLSEEGLRVRWEFVLIGTLTLVGAFFRFYRLDGILAEMGPDLPLNYLNIEEILNGNWPIFFPSFPGREALFFYWASIFARLFGNSHLTIKVAAAVIGTLTIPAAYLVARRLFDRGTGICAAAILAVSHWHIILSRIGYRAILMPLFFIVLAYLVADALDSPRDWRVARVGLWLGLGLYTYNSFLFAVPAFVVVMLVYWIARRGTSLLAVARSIGIAALGAFLVWIPLARYAYEHPEVYLQRVQSRLTGAEKPLPADVLGTLVNNIARTLGMFNFRGDEVFTVNVPFMREMGLITAVLFVLGLGYALVHWRRGFNATALGWLFTMLLPSALSIAFPNEVPNSDRASGGVVMALLIAAIPLPLLARQLFQALPVVRGGPWALPLGSFRGRRARIKGALELGTGWLLAAAALLLLVFEARAAFQTVFTTYVAKQPGANYSVSRELARILDDFVGNGPEYIEYWPHWFDGHALDVQLTRTTSDEILFVDNLAREAPALSDPGERALFLLHPEDQQALATLYRAFPRGSAIRYFDGLGNVRIIAFYAERQP